MWFSKKYLTSVLQLYMCISHNTSILEQAKIDFFIARLVCNIHPVIRPVSRRQLTYMLLITWCSDTDDTVMILISDVLAANDIFFSNVTLTSTILERMMAQANCALPLPRGGSGGQVANAGEYRLPPRKFKGGRCPIVLLSCPSAICTFVPSQQSRAVVRPALLPPPHARFALVPVAPTKQPYISRCTAALQLYQLYPI